MDALSVHDNEGQFIRESPVKEEVKEEMVEGAAVGAAVGFGGEEETEAQ